MKPWIVGLVWIVFGSHHGAQSARGANHPTLDDLAPLVGVWRSELDPKYKDHPMVQKFNPELNPQEMVFEWGNERRSLRYSIWDLDRPSDGDRTLLIEGVVLPNAANETLVLVDFNVRSSRVFLGEWNVLPDGDIVRTLVTELSGSSSKFRETWRFRDDARARFDWHTETFDDGAYATGDVVVAWHRAETPERLAGTPEWVQTNWKNLIGTWVADNTEFKTGDASMDAFGVEWRFGLGETSLVGRLYGIKDGEEVADFWEFREFWHPGEGQLLLEQIGRDGTYGIGPHERMPDGSTKMLQTFYNAGSGAVTRIGHRSTLSGDTHTTHSFDVSETEEWVPRRTYLWIRQR